MPRTRLGVVPGPPRSRLAIPPSCLPSGGRQTPVMPCYSSPFERLTIPLCQSGSGFVGTLEKLQQRQLRRGRTAHVIIAQEKESQLVTVEGFLRANRGRRYSRRLRCGIRVA